MCWTWFKTIGHISLSKNPSPSPCPKLVMGLLSQSPEANWNYANKRFSGLKKLQEEVLAYLCEQVESHHWGERSWVVSVYYYCVSMYAFWATLPYMEVAQVKHTSHQHRSASSKAFKGELCRSACVKNMPTAQRWGLSLCCSACSVSGVRYIQSSCGINFCNIFFKYCVHRLSKTLHKFLDINDTLLQLRKSSPM